MNYKELLDGYKKGLLSEKEKHLVEQELEKHEAFDEYISESFDEELDNMRESPSLHIHNEESRKLKKSVNKRLRKVVLTSVLAVIGLYFIVFYLISGIVDGLYYDPTAISQPKEEGYQYEDFKYDIQAYVSLNMPGYSINSFTFHDSKGFGKYEISYPMRNLFTKDEQRYFVDLSRGKLTTAMDGIFSSENRFWLWEGFERIRRDFSKDERIQQDFSEDYNESEINHWNRNIEDKNKKTIRYLNELNPLSFISMSIVFEEDLSMEDFYLMSKDYPSFDFKWVGIRTVEAGVHWSENQPMHLIGFNPNANDEPISNQGPDFEKYPLFNLSDRRRFSAAEEKIDSKAISERYGTHFKSRLKYLRDRETFVEVFDYNYLKTEFYDNALKYIDENGVKTYGVLVYGTAAEFLESIDKIPYDSIYINQVLPAKANIYNN